MMKIDEDALREKILQVWAAERLSPDATPEEIGQYRLMQRAAKLNAELTVFSSTELARHPHEVMQAVINIGTVLGNVLFSTCQQIGGSEESVKLTGMDGPHNAIHVLVESMAACLHIHYNDKRSELPEHTHNVAQFALPVKEVGDA